MRTRKTATERDTYTAFPELVAACTRDDEDQVSAILARTDSTVLCRFLLGAWLRQARILAHLLDIPEDQIDAVIIDETEAKIGLMVAIDDIGDGLTT